MHAVICDPGLDPSAAWATARLRERLGDVLLVHLDLLGLAAGFALEIDDAGFRAGLTLPDGRRFAPARGAAVLNRVARPPRALVQGPDADYAAEEVSAAAVAFLTAFGRRIVNAPHPSGLAGRERRPAEWRHLAALAGLPTRAWQAGDAAAPAPAPRQGVVIDGMAFGLPDALADAACALARLADLDILGLAFDAAGRLTGATQLPDLRIAGAPGIDALAALLAARAAEDDA